jgi:MraZ protein
VLKLLGEYDCKVDAKGRFLFPAGLKKQLGDAVDLGFVINADMHEDCLVVYPQPVWDDVSSQVMKLNRFVKKNAMFIRRFTNGATVVNFDASSRIQLPKALSERIAMSKDIKVVGSGDRVEIWSKDKFELMINEPCDLSGLSEEVMGDFSFGDE